MDFQERMERVRKWTDKLEAGITDLFQSDQYTAYLRAISKLHQYSYGNILLIKLQCPHFSMVASYGDWKRKYGRHVKEGETGITILAPWPLLVTGGSGGDRPGRPDHQGAKMGAKNRLYDSHSV